MKNNNYNNTISLTGGFNTEKLHEAKMRNQEIKSSRTGLMIAGLCVLTSFSFYLMVVNTGAEIAKVAFQTL
ncbi:MAG TPA: hypothetical protein VIK86_02085 [Candidatus Paceibacterota bacterium]